MSNVRDDRGGVQETFTVARIEEDAVGLVRAEEVRVDLAGAKPRNKFKSGWGEVHGAAAVPVGERRDVRACTRGYIAWGGGMS